MDSLDIENFNQGFEFAVNQTLPFFGVLVVLGVLIYIIKKVLKV